MGAIGQWNFGQGGNPLTSVFGGDLDTVIPPYDSAWIDGFSASLIGFDVDFTFQSLTQGIFQGFFFHSSGLEYC